MTIQAHKTPKANLCKCCKNHFIFRSTGMALTEEMKSYCHSPQFKRKQLTPSKDASRIEVNGDYRNHEDMPRH